MHGAWVAVPAWLVHGLALGLLASLAVAVTFAAGVRLLPAGTGVSPGDGGVSRRRAEIRGYLRAIDEPFVEDRGVGGWTAAFYLTDRDVAVTFDPRSYYRIEGTGTTAVLVEHELPGWRLGDRLPFDAPDVTPESRRGPTARTAYAELGLPPGAPGDAVERAYRERVKEVHPDHGGDAASFRRLREAYSAAIDDAGDHGRRAT